MENDMAKIDQFDDDPDDSADMRAARVQQKLDAKLPTLFKGLRFFVGRETPYASLAFVIRSCGGDVSCVVCTVVHMMLLMNALHIRLPIDQVLP